MATKSTNTQGNPYHDEQGRFTTKDGLSTGGNFSLTFDLGAIKQFASGAKPSEPVQTEAVQKQPKTKIDSFKSLSDLEAYGNTIFDKTNIVHFDPKTKIEVAKDVTKALEAVSNDFGMALGGIMSFGTNYNSMGQKEMQKNVNDFVNRFFNPNNSIITDLLIKRGKDTETIKSIRQALQTIDESLQQMKMSSGTLGYTQYQQNIHNTETGNEIMQMLTCVMLNKTRAQKVNGFATNYDSEEERKFYQEEIMLHKKNKAGAVFDTAAHELGHAVSRFLIPFMTKSEKKSLEFMTKTDFSLEKMKKYIPNKPGWYTTFKGPKSYDTSDIVGAFNEKQVSRYALYNEQEAYAEAFADYYGNGEGCSEYNKKIVNFFKKIYNERVIG